VDPQTLQGVQALATLLSGPTAGWVVAHFLLKRLDKKDGDLMAKHEAHIATLTENNKNCDERYNLILQRVFHLEDKKADKL
jgi:hypothetical protein